MRALVLTPPSYDREPARRYPVLYFLHDGWGDEGSLRGHGVAAELRRLMADGRLPEFLVVAPGARGSWFSDSYDGKRLWGQFLTTDLVRQVEARYRVIPAAAARGITGISMGGYGAVKLALRNPELYGSVSALSGALIPLSLEDLKRYNFMARWTLKRVFGGAPGRNTLAENDVWEILRASRFASSPFPLYLRGGSEDLYGLGRVGVQFASSAYEHGIAATAVLEPGGHDWDYWRRAIIPVCRWHAARFSYDRGGMASGLPSVNSQAAGRAATSAAGHRLVLFDIDGTLLSAGRAARESVLAALEHVYGLRADPDPPRQGKYDFSGKTDPQIVRELVTDAVGSERCEAGLDRALDRYLDELRRRLTPEAVVPKPGIPELLRRLAAEPGVTLALLTGNLERGARLKLEPPGFNAYFAFGAFGSDSADRYQLPRVAVERARSHGGRAFGGKSIVIVGDSVHDVACGRSLGVRAVAVATGPTPADRLASENPDALLPDFSDVTTAMGAILG